MPPELTPIQQAYAIIWQDGSGDLGAVLADHPELVATDGLALLIDSASRRRLDLVRILVEAGVDPDGVVGDETPLNSAARGGLVEIASFLLDHGAEVDKRPEALGGSTPLCEAVCNGHLSMVEFLLDRGADPNILHGNPQKNAVAMARLFRKEEIAVLLERRGHAEITVKEPLVDVEAPEFFEPRESTSPLSWFEQTWWHVFAFATERGFDALSARNRILFLVGYLIDQVSNGGIDQVYFNPSADYATRMPVALDQIGATRAASLIRAINALIPGGPSPAIAELDLDEMDRSLPAEARPLGEELEAIVAECGPNGEPILLSQLYDAWRS